MKTSFPFYYSEFKLIHVIHYVRNGAAIVTDAHLLRSPMLYCNGKTNIVSDDATLCIREN